jgi:hypothetical protein
MVVMGETWPGFVGAAAAGPDTAWRRRGSLCKSTSVSGIVVGEARRMIVEIGDQYSTSWTLSECDITGVGDAEVLAGPVDARTVVEARAGRRRAEAGLRSRILMGGGKGGCSDGRSNAFCVGSKQTIGAGQNRTKQNRINECDVGEGPCGSSSNCLRVRSGSESAGSAGCWHGEDQGNHTTGGVRKETEHDRPPSQLCGGSSWLSFN